MGTRTIEKKHVDEVGNEVVIKTIKFSYESGTLTASEVTKDENGAEVVTPYMVQPWKCYADGTRADFTGEEDAFEWAEQNITLF